MSDTPQNNDAPQSSNQPQNSGTTQNTNTPQKNNNTWWLIGLIGLAVVLVIAVIFLVRALSGSNSGSGGGPEIILPTPEPEKPTATALDAINIRSGPGTLYPSYGVAPKGSSAEVIGVSSTGQWWVVKLPTEIVPLGQGWVFGQYVQVTGGENLPVVPAPPEPPPVEIPPPPSGGPTATALDAIFVRSGPGTNYPAYGVAPKGAKGEVIGISEDRGWWVIKLPTSVVGEGQAWVSADWVTTSNTEGVPVVPPPDQQPPVVVPPPAEGVPTATALDYINVRSGPGINYASYGVAQPGASAEIVGKSEDGSWWVVKLPSVASGQAWVSADYVLAANAEGVPVIPAP